MLKQQLQALQERMELEPELREALRRKRELGAQHETLSELQSRLLMQQAEWELEHAYLEYVLESYGSVIAPEAARALPPGEEAESAAQPEAEIDRGN